MRGGKREGAGRKPGAIVSTSCREVYRHDSRGVSANAYTLRHVLLILMCALCRQHAYAP